MEVDKCRAGSLYGPGMKKTINEREREREKEREGEVYFCLIQDKGKAASEIDGSCFLG